jgi:hypothetical protein
LIANLKVINNLNLDGYPETQRKVPTGVYKANDLVKLFNEVNNPAPSKKQESIANQFRFKQRSSSRLDLLPQEPTSTKHTFRTTIASKTQNENEKPKKEDGTVDALKVRKLITPVFRVEDKSTLRVRSSARIQMKNNSTEQNMTFREIYDAVKYAQKLKEKCGENMEHCVNPIKHKVPYFLHIFL